MVSFVECVRFGAISCELADSIETDLQKENDKKIAVCINAIEKIKDISKIDDNHFTFKEICLRYLSAGLLLLPDNLQVKAVSLMEVCKELTYEALNYKDYLQEMRATAYENIERARTWFEYKTRMEMVFLKEIKSLLPHVNTEVLFHEQLNHLYELQDELADSLSRSEGLQNLYQARELMNRAISSKRRQVGVIDALDLLKRAFDLTIGIDQKARCIIASEMGYIYAEFDERPHAKIKAKEYYRDCIHSALENGYTRDFFWLKRSREYLAKVAAEMSTFGVTFQPSQKGIEVIEEFKKQNFDKKEPKEFLAYLAKHHPPKKGTMPIATIYNENECLTKATRLYHPDSNCFNRLGELYLNLAKDKNRKDVEVLFEKLSLEKGAVSSFIQSMINFVECVRYGAMSCELAEIIETELQKENDKKIAVCINALEQIKDISRLDGYEFSFKKICLKYLSAGLLILPDHFQIKAVSLIEVCEQLNYEGLKYKDYLREITSTPYEDIENVRTCFKDRTRMEMLFLKEIESLLAHVNKEILSEEKIDELNELKDELEDNLSRTAGLQKLYQARELMSTAIKDGRRQGGVIVALDLLKQGYDLTLGIDQKARCVIASEMGYIFIEFDERPHAKIKAKEYYKDCIHIALENGYTKEFYWLKRAREYLAKVSAETTHFGVTFNPSEEGIKIIQRFTNEDFSNKSATKFLNYLAKNHPPKKRTMPRVTGTPENIKTCLTKVTRLYHPDTNAKFDDDWKALCEQISMVANNLYSRIVKGLY
ncbi:Oidioi.mRNA.OKI2018_I69.XSR.g16856.t1.cds [Oikopleura dioica]|uniref:Oidioi.mRNA.OKI2018_I69.XSR.g16856.t1.cds n=1 Tax=Oikopleura dioica TaxID=34765 RepID=A0ABN7SHF3_OIKDI|nr:Oidioi.mRNA.OKI2018_I69.XSR.g16856.t1.cds [Oikopleura dioica]